MKINYDGAFDPNNKITFTRIVTKNSDGVLICGANRRSIASCVVHAEALAVKGAVNLALERKCQNICLEMDSREMHLILTSRCHNID